MLSQDHWDKFQSIPFLCQGQFGKSPVEWAKNHRIDLEFDGYVLSDDALTRQEVTRICQDKSTPVLFGYICAMAWGLQGAGRGGSRTVERAWEKRETIEKLLIEIRSSSLTRSKAYALFEKNPVPGIGPAYFTKLIYFFLPSDPIGYIMDQWTAKSINLLADRKIVRTDANYPTRSNTAENYEAFCQVIDILARKVGTNGDQFEQRLFSQNKRHPNGQGEWRKHVSDNWLNGKPAQRYNHQEMLKWVSDLKNYMK